MDLNLKSAIAELTEAHLGPGETEVLSFLATEPSRAHDELGTLVFSRSLGWIGDRRPSNRLYILLTSSRLFVVRIEETPERTILIPMFTIAGDDLEKVRVELLEKGAFFLFGTGRIDLRIAAPNESIDLAVCAERRHAANVETARRFCALAQRKTLGAEARLERVRASVTTT